MENLIDQELSSPINVGIEKHLNMSMPELNVTNSSKTPRVNGIFLKSHPFSPFSASEEAERTNFSVYQTQSSH